ncbi:hypothetical protein OKJ48_09860 [Streptomyces kunmingensis]|uniref:Uncharacterized protein n=1 Tax=Streptomyces kunmingensis TaxID=68225 RepID=A0ABU6C789_9ACTN|nr:hypothetical protein [Streptomyces kunmingensis]MEB3960549.1 hypothetical protein [Streptomyces kunmingensis]
MLFKRLKAATIAAAAVASVAVVATPAEASNCSRGGGVYICEHGVTTYKLPNERKQEFVVGTDSAVWTRYQTNSSGKWSGWQSMGVGGEPVGGPVRALDYEVYGNEPSDPWTFRVYYFTPSGDYWGRNRDHDGNWSPWHEYELPLNG